MKFEAGPELDALIAERVFWKVACDAWKQINLGSMLIEYSTGKGDNECDAWKQINLGSMGGPAYMSTGCEHGSNGCYARDVYVSGFDDGGIGGPPKYSSDMNEAIKVMEWIEGRVNPLGGVRVELVYERDCDGSFWWECSRASSGEHTVGGGARTPALAVCGLALLDLGIEIERSGGGNNDSEA